MNVLAEFQFVISRNIDKEFVRVKNRLTIDTILPDRAGGTGMAGVAAATPIFLLFRPNIFTFLNFPSRTEVHRFIPGPVELGWQLPPQYFDFFKVSTKKN